MPVRPPGRRTTWRDWVTGLWLFVIFLVSIVSVAVALTTYQLQHAIRTFDAGGQSLAVWEILESRDRWNEALLARLIAGEAVQEAKRKFEEKAAQLDELTLAEDQARQRRNSILAGFVGMLRTVGVLERDVAALGNFSDDELNNRVLLIVGSVESKTPYFLKELDRLESARRDLQNAYLDLRKAHQARDAIDAAIAELGAAEGRFQSVILALGADDRTRDTVGDFLNQLNYLSSLPFGRFFEFMATTSDLLTLILVFAMGTLGATIHLTRSYLSGTATGGVGYYLFRPLLGAITALAVYVIIRSGAMIVSDPAAAGSKSPLSPFFISFVAIISGLLSEQALVSIETTGARWFSSASGGPPRWAIGVASEIARQNKKSEEIEGLLDVDADRMKAWMEQREPVPFADQKILSAWLGKPIRELFSDLPPAGQTA